ncbi:MAG: restriction endonuclease [Bacteroidetes bacterium]|nr:MAG: restriction endonuclease [Bacteroidota bacterium]
MELKEYQQSVISDLTRYLEILESFKGNYAQSFEFFWDKHPNFSKKEKYRDFLPNIPHLCFKVPTAGGKTFIACNALKPLFEGLQIHEDKMVVWLVPSQAILEQTYNNLSNPKHFYNQKLRSHFGRNVEIYKIDDLLDGKSFSPTSVRENLSILVLSYQSIRADKLTKENRRIYKDNGLLMAFFENETDKSYQLQMSEVESKSLINVIRKYNPVCVIDEAHNATTPLSIEMLKNINPCFVLELTATPRKDAKKPDLLLSNVLSFVDSFPLKKENMVKLPLLVNNLKSKNEVLERAISLQKELEEKAQKSPVYIRPIVLLQAQNSNKDKETDTFGKIKQDLLEKNIPDSHIAIKTATIDEIKGVDLLDRKCKIRYIITIDALKEGWDCPFAYVLATVANKTSDVQIEQIVGRILRKPYTKEQEGKYLRMLNMSYVLASSSKFQEVLDKIVKALNGQGFSEEDIKKFPEKTDQNAEFALTLSQETEYLAEKSESTTNFTDFAQESEQIYEQDRTEMQAQILQGKTPIPADLKNKVNINSMKTQFKEMAEKIKLPQFFIETEKLTIFEPAKEVKLDYENLLRNFELKNQSIDIDFDKISIDLYEIDLEVENENKSRFARAKATEAMQELYLKAFSGMTDEGKKSTLVAKLIKYMGNIPPFDEKDLKLYVRRIVDSKNVEEMNQINNKQNEFAQKIKIHIQKLASEYAEKNFYRFIDSDKIFLKPSFSLPTHTTSRENATIKNSLYGKTETMNLSEQKFISDITSLENVIFWHKFANRGQDGFCLNACFTNHYPDFLIFTKNKKCILVETKGDHLHSAETERKRKIGEKWASLAGREFRYFMVFESIEVENCYNLNNIKSLIRDL